MNFKNVGLITLAVILVSACSHSLVSDIYRHAHSGQNVESATAFVALSNMSLYGPDIERIKNDYEGVKDKNRKYYYEFLLAKRTQEEKFIKAFIKSSSSQLLSLSNNNTGWVSIGSPFYSQLSLYSKTYDEALIVLFELAQINDGANLAIVSEDLFDVYKMSPERFSSAAMAAGVDDVEILNSIKEE